MASTNVYSIPLYNKGFLSAVGYREGCGYNAKIFWGSELLASRPSLEDAIITAYIGTRLYSPRFHSWMAHYIRVEILDELEKMSNLIFPSKIQAGNEALVKNLKLGMKWFLDNKLEVKVADDAVDPVKTIEIIRNEFMKSDRLIVNIKLLSDFTTNPREDLLSVSVGEEAPKKTLQMCVMEENLPVHLFGPNWTSNAINSFNSFRRISAQPGEPVPVLGTLSKMAMPDGLAPVDIGTWRSAVTNKLQATFDLKPKTGDLTLNLNGNTISMNSDSLTISAPKIDPTLSNQIGYSRDIFSVDPDSPELSEFGKMIRKVGLNSSIELDKNIPIYFVQAYAEMQYTDPDTKMPMPMMKFIKLIGWNYLETHFEQWVSSITGGSELATKDPYAHAIVKLAVALAQEKTVVVPAEHGTTRQIESIYLA